MTFSTEDFAKALEAHSYDFQVGTTVRGTIIDFANDGATVDIGGKSAAFCPFAKLPCGPCPLCKMC